MTSAPPDRVVVRSPGRVNIIGEHTDYNLGWVLPAAIDLGTDVTATARADRTILVRSMSLAAGDSFPVDDPRPEAGPAWARNLRGCVLLLRAEGVEVPGAELVITGDLPIGAGLSSSASVGLGVATALLALAGASMAPTELARLAQQVENEIVGVASGIMDQLAVTFGRGGHALLIDCRSTVVEPVPLPPDLRLLVLDSGVPRRLTDSAYNERRAECARAVTAVQRLDPSVASLRDVGPEHLAAAVDLMDPVAARRARHVLSENGRVLDAAEAMRQGDGEALGRLLAASHASLRDDFEVSGPELDALVAIAVEVEGVLGARLTGAGFGGCAVAIATSDHADRAADTIATRYREATGRAGAAHVCAAADGVRVT